MCKFEETYPRQYVAYMLQPGDAPPVVDGKLDEPVWADVPWTEDFVDIATNVTPRYRTRAKVRWDSTWLYIGALLEEPNVWATLTQHDSVIFRDNDFEIFVNADGTTHYYKEYEMNAFNTSWDLCLNKDYIDCGYENSSRVFGPHGWDMEPPLYSAVWVDGAINNPSLPSYAWSVEVAMPLDGLLLNETVGKPKNGTFWRINFSRVEYRVDVVNNTYHVLNPNDPDNWLWAPMGVVDVHLPEKWGMLQFSVDPPNSTAPVRNDEWTVRTVAMALYNAQAAYRAATGAYAFNVADLLQYAPPHTLDGTCTVVPAIHLTPSAFGCSNNGGYKAVIEGLGNPYYVATIRDDRFLQVNSSARLV